MKTVQIDVKSDVKASRLELFIRIVWMIPTYIVFWLFSIVAGICMVLHWLFILITGKRNNTLNDIAKKYLIYVTEVQAYLYLLTDERNPIFPEN
jgi:hypothetical protein